MNRTKRAIFIASLKLFSEKGYEATSIEEITAIAGIAKGTLYYHFSSKEEIFNSLVEEGMLILKNSIKMRIEKCDNTIDKLKAVIFIELKCIKKYEEILTLAMSQFLGNEQRHKFCQEQVKDYLKVVQDVIDEGIEKKDIVSCDSNLLACEIFSLAYATMIHKRINNGNFDIDELLEKYEKSLLDRLK